MSKTTIVELTGDHYKETLKVYYYNLLDEFCILTTDAAGIGTFFLNEKQLKML